MELKTGYKVKLKNGMVGVVLKTEDINSREVTSILLSTMVLNYTTDYDGFTNTFSDDFSIVEVYHRKTKKPYTSFYKIEQDDLLLF